MLQNMRASFVICDVGLDDGGVCLLRVCRLKMINSGFSFIMLVLMKGDIARRGMHRRQMSKVLD